MCSEKKAGLEDSVIREISQEVEQEIEEAARFAEESPDPDVAEVLEDIYS